MKFFAVPTFLFIIFSIITAQTQENIAVNRLVSSGISKSEAFTLTEVLRSELGKTGKYTVLERGQMEEILKEQGFQQSGACDDQACAIEMGKLLSVQYIILGSIGQVGKTYNFNIRLVSVGTGEVVKEVTENYKGQLDKILSDIVPMAAQKLAGTWKKKKPVGALIGGGIGVAGLIAIPIIYFATREEEPTKTSETDLRLSW